MTVTRLHELELCVACPTCHANAQQPCSIDIELYRKYHLLRVDAARALLKRQRR